ncbi:yae1 domain-containing protein 1-like [Aphis craccivora]|uniref:Yae1 domain-containing protein 1-like n=1 Tax=Aphis craccivora TaxID=307492 RepID=A0A6G0YR04_APHCR|nr:yae1 domain-containing protein 1-like [Aphis craccivora]
MSTCQYDNADVSSDDEQEIMKRNWKKNISTIEKTAFREGATSTKIESDVMFQMGFDNGYKDGFKDGYNSGSYKSTLM